MIRGRPLIFAALACFTIFIISTTTYWWRTTEDHGSLSSLLSPLRTPLTTSHASNEDDFPIEKKVAVIIETRALPTLIPLILHFSTILGPSWPILLLTRASTLHTLSAYGHGSQPFKRLVGTGQVKILELPSEPYLGNYEGLSHFLASTWFWDKMGMAEYMLNFQTDSILCANSVRKVEDFFGYDFVGAWHPWVEGAFNGGLSLRNVSLARQVVERYNIDDDVDTKGSGDGIFEDVWFCRKMRELGGRFPDEETASGFAVDLVWGERPLGYHGVNKSSQWQALGGEKIEEMWRWCPEAKLAVAKQEDLVLNEEELGNYTAFEDGPTEGGRRLYMD